MNAPSMIENAAIAPPARAADAADARARCDGRAFLQLRDDFLFAVLADPATRFSLPGESRPQAVGDLIAQNIVDEPAHELLRIVAELARGRTGDLQARAMTWLGDRADELADRYCDALSVQMQDAERDAAEDEREDMAA